MRLLKKSFVTLLGGMLVLLGLVFILVPGPSLLFILPGLFILSFEYPAAQIWLRKSMKLMQKSAQWVDRQIRGKHYH